MLVRIAVIKIRILVLDMNCDGELDIVAVCKSGYLEIKSYLVTDCIGALLTTLKPHCPFFYL